MRPHILSELEKDCVYNSPILEMKIGDELSVNQYVRKVRQKDWHGLFRNRKFMGNMTSNLANAYCQQVDRLSGYDFSLYNIKTIQAEMSQNLLKG